MMNEGFTKRPGMKSKIIICFILSTFCFGFMNPADLSVSSSLMDKQYLNYRVWDNGEYAFTDNKMVMRPGEAESCMIEFRKSDTTGIETLPEDICLVAGDNALTIARAGGRIISFTHNGKEILTQKNEHENYGSTLWTDPQSNWNWPPYEALDQLNYEGGMMGDSLCLTSRKDEKSGFQIEKIVKADSLRDCFHITYIIRNVSGESKSVGPWEVTRMPAKGISFFMRGEAARLPESNLDGATEKEGVVWFSLNDAPLKGGQKLFSTARGGWLAHVYQGLLFVKQFEDISPRQLAPQQGEIEIYASEDKAYIELENHGIYRLLQPGESLHYSVTWHLLKLPDDIRVETGNSRLIEMVQKTIL